MTTVSGTSSASTSASTGSSAATLATAQSIVKSMITSQGFFATLQNTLADSSSKTPTAQQVLSTLMSLINPSGAKTISKSGVQAAVTELGGSTAQANALWSQLSPYGLNKISASSVEGSNFIVSAVSSNMTTVEKSYATYNSSVAGIAGKTMSMLLTSNDVIGGLSAESSTYVPPTADQMASEVWALFDVNGTKSISESDVKTAVVAEGGTVAEAEDLWKQLSPSGAGAVGASQFVEGSFVTSSLTANAVAVQTAVGKYQLANTGTSGSVLDQFSSNGADVLDGAASGYNDSPVGGGGYSNDLNLFA
jgi:hypothetical protein